MYRLSTLLVSVVILIFTGNICLAQQVIESVHHSGDSLVFSLSNDKVIQQVIIRDSLLAEDDLSGRSGWLATYGTRDHGVRTDGGFALKMMWTDWSAPGKIFNGDLQLTLTKKDYQYTGYLFRDENNGGKILELYFQPFDPENTVDLRLDYELLPGKFYSKRRVVVRDTILHKDWLEEFISRQGNITDERPGGHDNAAMIRAEGGSTYQQVNEQVSGQQENNRIIKKGAFGQPCAVDFAGGGVFFGIEYPAADNDISRKNARTFYIRCIELIGTVVRQPWVKSQWVVEGLAPDQHIKDWFFNYLPDIQVAPNKPYALYNSWYDLRSPLYPGVAPDHVMNEKNILHIIHLFRKNMIDRYHIHLDAFVLDDGWDTYDSDWVLRSSTFPHGLAPIVDSLKVLGTTLGMWFGPTGGYSFRMRRINWMKAHGYETVGSTPNDEMMDIAGPRYSRLLRRRTSSFDRQGVGYFKWDGIQFSSSEPGNGHPVGYHSRRAALEKVIAMCRAVRAVNPETYLNITSGTWLSPWWLKYANQIWMQGEDYGYADVPSINARDAAVTYKDYVLYDDLHNQDVWFPVSNMMTHGIIKGDLANLGGQDDPLDRFTDDAVLYFGRGVSMYEMYISPDLLNPGEWNALSSTLNWARDRFKVMEKTYMIGGDPTLGQAYGYVHFLGDSGIIAIRNPVMLPSEITLKLDPGQGLDRKAGSLVLERIYPDHWISPVIYAAGARVSLPLSGYTTAVYELYPLEQADKPLLAGVTYDQDSTRGDAYSFHVLKVGPEVHLLNPWMVRSLKANGQAQDLNHIHMHFPEADSIISKFHLTFRRNSCRASIHLDPHDVHPRYVLFLRPEPPDRGKKFPEAELLVDGKKVQPTLQIQNGTWACYSIVMKQGGKHVILFKLVNPDAGTGWKGSGDIWIESKQTQPDERMVIYNRRTLQERPELPAPWKGHELLIGRELGTGGLGF